MTGKARNRKPLETATCLCIDSLGLARMPAGWSERGKAIRAVRVLHQRRGRTVSETELHAEVEAAGGKVRLEHRGTDGALIEQLVQLEPVAQHFGGQRWFFCCPVTGDRARKLYRYPGMLGFCSRRGLPDPVTYRSQRDSGAERVMRQIWELRAKLGDKNWMLGRLDKPDDMVDAEFHRYVVRYLELTRQLDCSIHGFRMKRTASR